MHGVQRNSTADRAGTAGAGSSDGSLGVVSRARNQRLLREVNDRIAELAGWNETGVSLFLCECSGRECADALEIGAAEYARIRADTSYFVVLPGHEQPGLERIVDRNDRYVVVANEGQRDG